MTAYDHVCTALARRTGGSGRNGQWPCPAHDDSTPSLSVTQGRKGVALHCHAGCPTPDVMNALGLPVAALYDDWWEPKDRDEIVATYPYHDEHGKVLFEVVRKAGKKFLQRRPDGDGGWVWKLDDTRRVLYRLPQVKAAVFADRPVYIAEGEKDVHALEQEEVVATCNPGGAGKWRPEYTAELAGADVIVIADRDRTGRDHARAICRALDGVAASVTAVQARTGKDAADHLAAGHTVDELEPLDLTLPEPDDQPPPPPLENSQPPDTDAEGPANRYTDVGNARRLVAGHGHEMRWVQAWGTWLVYDGRRWKADTKGRVTEFAKEVAVQLLDEANTLAPGTDLRKKVLGWSQQSESASRIEAMIKLARSEPGIPVDPDELDANHWALNLPNGTLDLRTGALGPHDPAGLITKLAPIELDPDAACPRWVAFLERILPDLDVREFVQRWFGYCLTGDVSEHKLVFAHGVGANGKSTLQNVMAHVLGDYATQAAPDLLMRRHDDPHPTGLADLHGARLVLATETSQGRHLDEALVKRLTGGDRVKARKMHRDFFEFAPTHKLVVGTNHRPGIEGTDHGIWRRIRLVPFLVVIPDDEQDKQLEHKLTAEAGGVLRWALEGCLAWQKEGLTEPTAVAAATADYRADMDLLGEFISDCCLLVEGLATRASVLYESYRRWSDTMGERRPLTKRRFGLSLRERGLTKRTSNGVWWEGIVLSDRSTSGNGHAPEPPPEEPAPAQRPNPHDEMF